MIARLKYALLNFDKGVFIKLQLYGIVTN